MSVAEMLGVRDIDGLPMRQARCGWERWGYDDPVLQCVDDLTELREWTLKAEPAAKDNVLRALARTGSATGSDDVAAVTALTWALVPGASMIASRLGDRSAQIEQIVAGQLWLSARTFEWKRRRFVASSILRDTLRGVQAELGIGDGARRTDRTWSKTAAFEPASPAWFVLSSEPEPDPLIELAEVLADAVADGVVTEADRAILIELSIAADQGAATGRRGRGGLMTPAASQVVGERRGISARTVRRRAATAIDGLAGYVAEMLDDSPFERGAAA